MVGGVVGPLASSPGGAGLPCAVEWPVGAGGLAGKAGTAGQIRCCFTDLLRVFELRAMGFQSSPYQRVVGVHDALRVLMRG